MPSLTPSRRRALVLAAVLVLVAALLLRHHGGGAAAAGGGLVRAPIVPSEGVSPARAKRLVVDVVGAVRRPGVYRFAGGARVETAVQAAGGLTRTADRTLVNLAAPLADGEQVVVPARGSGAPSAAGGAAGPVNLNAATAEQLDALPGIGPVTAQKIVDYRQQHGFFSSVDGLDAIPGIGPAKVDQLRGLVSP